MVTVGAETRSKLAVDGQIRMLIEEGHITLISPEGKRVMRWSMGQLRRFGYKINNFHLEAGRKSESGEGVFSFVTNQARAGAASRLRRRVSHARLPASVVFLLTLLLIFLLCVFSHR